MDDGRIKQATTILQYKDQFLRALNPDDNPDFPAKLGDLVARLKMWRSTLQEAVDESIEPVLKLEEETRGLMVQSLLQVKLFDTPNRLQDRISATALAILLCRRLQDPQKGEWHIRIRGTLDQACKEVTFEVPCVR